MDLLDTERLTHRFLSGANVSFLHLLTQVSKLCTELMLIFSLFIYFEIVSRLHGHRLAVHPKIDLIIRTIKVLLIVALHTLSWDAVMLVSIARLLLSARYPRWYVQCIVHKSLTHVTKVDFRSSDSSTSTNNATITTGVQIDALYHLRWHSSSELWSHLLSYPLAVVLVLLHDGHAVLHSHFPLLHHLTHSISLLLELQSISLQSLPLQLQALRTVLMFLLLNLLVNADLMIWILNSLVVVLICSSLLILFFSFYERLWDRLSLLTLFLLLLSSHLIIDINADFVSKRLEFILSLRYEHSLVQQVARFGKIELICSNVELIDIQSFDIILHQSDNSNVIFADGHLLVILLIHGVGGVELRLVDLNELAWVILRVISWWSILSLLGWSRSHLKPQISHASLIPNTLSRLVLECSVLAYTLSLLYIKINTGTTSCSHWYDQHHWLSGFGYVSLLVRWSFGTTRMSMEQHNPLLDFHHYHQLLDYSLIGSR